MAEDQDYAKARDWFEKAAAAGNADAIKALAAFNDRATRRAIRAAASGRYADAWRLREESARAIEVDETKSEGKPGPSTADGLGEVSWAAVFAREFPRALAAAERAHSLDPGKLWLEVNHAHALMFAGRTEEARALYLSHKNEPVEVGDKKPWRQAIADDFVELLKAWLVDPLMDRLDVDLTAKAP